MTELSSAIGVPLRAAREAHGLSVEDVAEATRIRPRVLQALEAGALHTIGPPFYVRSFLRTYSEELGIDPAPLLAEVPDAGGPDLHAIPGTPPASPAVETSPLVRRLSTAVTCLLLLGVLVVTDAHVDGPASTATPEPLVPVVADDAGTDPRPAVPLPAPSPRAVETEPARDVALVVLGGESWIRVTVDGEVLEEGIQPHGWVLPIDGDRPVVVRAGNAGVVHLRVGEDEPVPLGAPGAVVEVELAPQGDPSVAVR